MTFVTSNGDTPTFRLLDLPPELRLIIYEFAIPDILKHTDFFYRVYHHSLKSFRCELLNTCKFIQHEALSIYAEELTHELSKVEKKVQDAKDAKGWGPFSALNIRLRQMYAEFEHYEVSGVVKEERNKIAAVEKQRTKVV